METFIVKRRIPQKIALLAVLIALAMSGFSQEKPKHECSEKEKSHKSKRKPVAKQKSVWTPIVAPGNPSSAPSSPSRPFDPPAPPTTSDDVAEKSIAVYPKVYVDLCVSKGKVSVNGWKRNEVRAFVSGGSKLGFRVRERKGEEKKPAWIEIVGYSLKKVPLTRNRSGSGTNVFVVSPRCLSGKSIELDVPKNASVKIRSERSDTKVDTVRWAHIENNDGSIFLNRIGNGIKAQTFRGNVTVRESGGKMNITTTSGDIVAYKTETNEIGDYLKAKTYGGAITLQSVGQREVEANSVSGLISFVGEIANYGRYNFGSQYGAITLAVPSKTSCRFTASYGGGFKSDLSLKGLNKNRVGNLTHATGSIGDGTCNLTFRTVTGSIWIRKYPDSKPVIANNFIDTTNLFPGFKFSSQ